MIPIKDQDASDGRDERPREIKFSIIDSAVGSGELLNAESSGTLVDLDEQGMSLLTAMRVEPGNIVRLDHEGVPKVGIVMWSVESAENCRIQIRFI